MAKREIKITNCPGHWERDPESGKWRFVGHIEFHREDGIYTYHVPEDESATIDRSGPVYERIAYSDGRCVTKVHHFGVDLKQPKGFFDAIAVYLMLSAPDDTPFELVLPDLNSMELLAVFHQDELPERIFPNLYPEICKGGMEQPLQWGPKYARLIVRTAGELAKWAKVPRDKAPRVKTDSDLYRSIVTRPLIDASEGDSDGLQPIIFTDTTLG